LDEAIDLTLNLSWQHLADDFIDLTNDNTLKHPNEWVGNVSNDASTEGDVDLLAIKLEVQILDSDCREHSTIH
jgi:hypothetical protein